MFNESLISDSARGDETVIRAFNKQSASYEKYDSGNPVIQELRQQVYRHVSGFIKPYSIMLELNAGTGIDAMHFVANGHRVHATDISEGMIRIIQKKILANDVSYALSCEQISFTSLDELQSPGPFDYVFSNFGGMNCCKDLSLITKKLGRILKPGGFVTCVIMPPVYLWELASLLKGNFKNAFRRFGSKGAIAHLEGEYFETYYFSLHQIRSTFPPEFTFLRSEGLSAITPPPHRRDFPSQYPSLFKILLSTDILVRDHFPFNRWADHLIVTFQYCP